MTFLALGLLHIKSIMAGVYPCPLITLPMCRFCRFGQPEFPLAGSPCPLITLPTGRFWWKKKTATSLQQNYFYFCLLLFRDSLDISGRFNPSLICIDTDFKLFLLLQICSTFLALGKKNSNITSKKLLLFLPTFISRFPWHFWQIQPLLDLYRHRF